MSKDWPGSQTTACLLELVRMAGAKKKRNSAMELCLHFPPFLVHVALVLIVGWIGSRLNWNLPLVFGFGLAYLYFVEGRIKAKTESRIRSEARRANDRKRLLSDAETARWLNSTVEAVWPIFLENFASQKFLMSLAPWFFEKYKPRTAKNVVLQQICLGRYPPVFSMLRCGRNPTDGDHLVLEMDMKYVAARDMRALIAVQMRKRVGLGLWTSLNISNIQIEGKLRVGVRFTKGWPVVERLRVCFAEAPILRMTAKPIINYGIDVTDLPGLASWIDKMIADALEHSLVEPNVLEVDVEKLVGSLMAVYAQLKTTTSSKPGPWFSVGNANVPRVACLTVEILEAKKLKPSDPNGKADPYVKVKLGSTKFVTAIKHKTLQPAWYEKFHFPVESWDVPNKLQLVVRDFDRFSHDDNMGYTEIECKEFNDGQRHEMWVTLDEVKTGQLRIAITVEEVPVVALKEGAKTMSSLESGKVQTDVPPSGEKVTKAATNNQGDENDQDSPGSDYEECSLRGEREAVDVGYGHLGAVSIVTPGKAKVKEATNLERLRQRRKPAASTVRVDGGGRSAHFTDPLGVTTEGKRSRLKRFWKKDRKSSSQSDSSGELGIVAMGEKGTEVHMTVETDGEGFKDVAPEALPSSGELQVDCGDGPYEDSRAEKRGMKKVQNMMHRIGKKAHTVSSAISKMSPSKKRSHSGKNLGEIPVSGIPAETDIPEALSSTHEVAGDMENLQAEITSHTQRQVNAVNDVETSKEIHESEAGKGNSYITRHSFVPTAPSTASDKDSSSVGYPTPRTDADHVNVNSIPTATSTNTEKSAPAPPFRTALEVSSGPETSSSTDIKIVKTSIKDDLDGLETDTGLPSCAVVRDSGEEQVNGLETSPKVLTEGITQISPTKTLNSSSEAAQGFGQTQLVEPRTTLIDLEQESSNRERPSEVKAELYGLSDRSPDSSVFTYSNTSLPPSRPPPEMPTSHHSATSMRTE